MSGGVNGNLNLRLLLLALPAGGAAGVV